MEKTFNLLDKLSHVAKPLCPPKIEFTHSVSL